MTTIAYSCEENKIAFDGRATCGNVIVTDTFKKYVVHDDFILFFAGVTSDVDRMAAIVESHSNGDIVDLESAVDIEVLFVKDGVAYAGSVTPENEYYYNEITYNYAFGSGGHFALAAMDLGKSVKESVKYASTRDSGTGGKISVCDVKTGKIK